MFISCDYYTRNTEHWLKAGVNERETRFASGMERDRSHLSRPEILAEWMAPKISGFSKILEKGPIRKRSLPFDFAWNF